MNRPLRELDEFTLRRALRDVYAPPPESYWNELEASILLRLQDAAAPSPLDLLARWSRVGLVAAGLAALVAGLAAFRVRDAEARVAFETVFRDSSPVVALQTAAADRAPLAREATLRYLIIP